MPVDTQLVDSNVVYCDEGDVMMHIRNKAYDDLPGDRSSLSGGGGLTKADVDTLIQKVSDKFDNYTKRAYRTRKAVDVELDIQLTHDQKHSRHRRRKVRGSGRHGRHNFQLSQRGFVDLPHNHVKPIDGNVGDSVVILNVRSTNDITANEGRDEGDFVVSNRKGILRPDIDLLTPVGTNQHGQSIDDGDASVRVTYRYGFPVAVTDYTGGDTVGDGPLSVSPEVPFDVRDAVGLLAASRIVGSDQYGEQIPNTGDDSPSLSDAASSWRSEAMSTFKEYRRA